MPQLTDPWFDAKFYGQCNDKGGYTRQDGIEGAQGIFLWCPCGFGKAEFPLDGGRPHGLIIPFRNPRNAPPVPANHGPHSAGNPDGPRPRWLMSGSSLADLTLQPSIAVGTPECWHNYITAGVVTL